MERFNYYDAVRECIQDEYQELARYYDFISFDDFYDFRQALYDDLFGDDAVTGNASGSYTVNAWEAEENVCHNLELLGEALEAFGCGPDYLMTEGPEACDVTIRCYVLDQCLYDIEDELESYYEERKQEEEEEA